MLYVPPRHISGYATGSTNKHYTYLLFIVNFNSLDIRGTSVSIEGVASALESLSETLIDLEYHLSFAAVLKFANGPNAGLLKLRKLEIDLDQFLDEEVSKNILTERDRLEGIFLLRI